MPTKTIKPRGNKIKQSVRHAVKQNVVVNVRVGGGGRRVSSQRAPSAMLLKTLMTRPIPPQVITIPQMGATPSIEQMRDVARQEILIKDMMEKQAVMMSRMNQQGFYRDQEGVLTPQVGADEKARLEEDLRASRAELQRLYDEQLKESPYAVKPVIASPAPPPPPPPPPKIEVPEMKTPVKKEPVGEDKGTGDLSPFQEELKKAVGKSPFEIQVEKALEAVRRRSDTANLTQIQKKGKRRDSVLEAYRRHYDLDPSTTIDDIIAYLTPLANQRKKKPTEPEREEDEGPSSQFVANPVSKGPEERSEGDKGREKRNPKP